MHNKCSANIIISPPNSLPRDRHNSDFGRCILHYLSFYLHIHVAGGIIIFLYIFNILCKYFYMVLHIDFLNSVRRFYPSR